MSDYPVIACDIRTEFGKGAARRVRRDHKIPAVLYGHGTAPLHLAMPGHATMLAVKVDNAVLELEVEGRTQLALVKDVQRDAIKPVIDHIDLVIVRRGEKVVVEVAVIVTGNPAPDTMVAVDSMTLQVEAEATRIPESFEVSVEGLAAGTQVLAGQVELPDGVTLVADPEQLVVNVTAAISAEDLDTELAGAEAGIERDAADDAPAPAAPGAEKESDADAS